MSEIGEIIKEARLGRGLTLEQVGKAVGVGKSTVLKWENGAISNMRRDKIAVLAKVLNISPSVLIVGDADAAENEELNNPIPQYDNIFPIAKKRFPLLGEIACGEPIFANEDRESYVDAGTEIHADFCLRAKGDSMVNARIHDGDIVFIRNQPSVENGEIAAVIIDDEATLKRVTFFPEKGMLILKAENPKYQDLIYMGEELNTIRVLGLAVAFQSDIK